MISAINEADLGWKADVCKYTKTHEKYGDHCDNEEQIVLAQVDSDDTLEGQKEFGADGDKEFEAVLAKA